RICAGATGLFAVSDDYLRWGLSYARRPRGANDDVFLLGYDPQLAAASAADGQFLEQLGIRPHHFVLCFIGTFGATYDLRTVITVARALHEEGDRSIRIVLGGSGPRFQEWTRMAAEVPNVVFPGWLSGGRIAALLMRANVGLASYADG